MVPSSVISSSDAIGLEFQLSLLRIAYAGEPPSSQTEELSRLLTTGYRPVSHRK